MKPYDFGISELSLHLDALDKKLAQSTSDEINGVSRILSARGKRNRPSIVIAIAHHSGKEIDDSVINAATAVELVHVASLIHDDIMDGGTLRHGVATINHRDGLSNALLAGDYLLAKGCYLASMISAEAATIVAEAISQLCQGQALELRYAYDTTRSKEALLSAVRGKTSSLFIVACKLGALVSGLDEAELERLVMYADNLGIAYQYLDDLNDFTETEGTADKSAVSDIAAGNYTMAVLLSLQGQKAATLKKLLKNEDVPLSEVREILEKEGSLNIALNDLEAYKARAIESIDKLDNTRLAEVLIAFADHLVPSPRTQG